MPWWNPVSWYDDAVNAASDIGSDIKGWVLDVVHKAALGLDDAFHELESDVTNALDTADRAIIDIGVNAWNATSSLSMEIGQVAQSALSEAYGYASALADRAESVALSAVHDAESLATAGINAVEGSLHALEVDVINPIAHFVDTAVVWWDKLITSWWHDTYNAVIHPIERDLDEARHDIAIAAEWIEHTGYDVAKLVYKAADWLVWLGIHSIEDLEQLPSDIMSLMDWHTVSGWIMEHDEAIGTIASGIAHGMFGGN